ncbi:MBL fold metallo-hydrolase [Spirosoma aerophilum]
MISSTNPARLLKRGRSPKTTLLWLASVVLLTSIASFSMMISPQFGKAPSGPRLDRIQRSPHYKECKFQNLHPTPVFAPGYNMAKAVYEVMIKPNPRKTPVDVIPSEKTDLRAIPLDRDVLVWFGHSSYYLQLGGKRFLIDPVFSGNASPFPGGARAFKGTDVYTVADLPLIDYLLITHDHYDHLDYKTVLALRPNVQQVICGLGVGAHFEHWGYPAERIRELDWEESLTLADGFSLRAVMARHGSGRTLRSDKTLWVSFILEAPSQKLFLGGDSGYDTHFAQIGRQYGPFDLAILENGQYDVVSPFIHMMPEETLQAALDLRANRVLPVHSAKFVLNRHPWDEPLIRLSKLARQKQVPLITPLIGQAVNLRDSTQRFSPWWEGLN